MLFKKKLDETNRKPNKMWVDKVCNFYNRPMKPWFQDNYVEMYSMHNEGKSVVVD